MGARGIWAKIEYIVDRSNEIAAITAGIVLAVAGVAVVIYALSRYLFKTPIGAIGGGVYYLMPLLFAFPLGYTLLKGGHVGVTTLTDLYPRWLLTVVKFLANLLILFCSVIMVWTGWIRGTMATDIQEYAPGFPYLRLIEFIVPMVVGFIILVTAAIITLKRDLTLKKADDTGESPELKKNAS